MKKLISFNAVVLLYVSFFFQSCTLFRFAYSPTIQNVPAFTKKNESRITTTIAGPLTSTESNFSIQGAYALTNHFALTTGMYGTAKSQDELTHTDANGVTRKEIIKYKRNSFDFGMGIFYPISQDKKVFIEAYAGYGFGINKITDMTNTSTTNFHNSNTSRFYLQPVLSFHPSQNFVFSTSLRYTSIGYDKIKTSYTQSDLASYYLETIATKRLEFLEPVLVLCGGLKKTPWILLQGQINFSLLMNENKVHYRNNYFSIGLQFDPVKAFKRKKIKY